MQISSAEARHACLRRLPTRPFGLLLVTLALLACGSQDAGGSAAQVTTTAPGDTELGVALNTRVSATFDRAMNPLTEATFTLSQGGQAVAGSVTTTPDGKSSVFTPTTALGASTVYAAKISTGATSTDGTALSADHSWTFTTGDSADTSSPAVVSTTPSTDATGIAVNVRLQATFNKAMDPTSLTSSTFNVHLGGTAIAGTVTYGPGTIATFTSSAPLAPSSRIDAELTAGVRDLNGNALAAAYQWGFTTGTAAAKGPAAVGLGTAQNYAVLAKSGVSSVPGSTVTGDVGLSPAAATFLTGFSLVADSTNVFSTSTQIVGKAYAANYAVPTPSNLTTAVSNMEAAYSDAAGRPTPDFLELGTGNIGGKTLTAGLYKWTTTITIPADLTLSGGANDVWIFQTTGDLSMSASKHITLSGGAQAKNIFWQVAGQATFGAGAHFEGILLCKTDVTLQTGATMNGRILSQTQVALQQATVSQPSP